jgi:hypothetical protein
MVNEGASKGLWRFRDTDNDDQFDKAELLIKIDGSGEHGPHSVVVGPDKKSLWLCDGNHTKPIETIEYSRPIAWDEDHIISRLWDANGHAAAFSHPAGTSVSATSTARTVEMVDIGFRNTLTSRSTPMASSSPSIATWNGTSVRLGIGRRGSFTARAAAITAGAQVPGLAGRLLSTVCRRRSRGTGITDRTVFGTGAKFPAKYQRAMYALDWTYGTMWAVHLTPDGASFKGEFGGVCRGQATAADRRDHSPEGWRDVFRDRRTPHAKRVSTVSHTRNRSDRASRAVHRHAEAKIRHDLEALHAKGTGPEAIDKAWPYLSHKDRFLRFAARVAIEHQPVAKWATVRSPSVIRRPRSRRSSPSPRRAAARSDPRREGDLEERRHLDRHARRDASAGCRVAEEDHRRARPLDFAKLTPLQRMGLLRAYELCFTRLGKPGRRDLQRRRRKAEPALPEQGSARKS